VDSVTTGTAYCSYQGGKYWEGAWLSSATCTPRKDIDGNPRHHDVCIVAWTKSLSANLPPTMLDADGGTICVGGIVVATCPDSTVSRTYTVDVDSSGDCPQGATSFGVDNGQSVPLGLAQECGVTLDNNMVGGLTIPPFPNPLTNNQAVPGTCCNAAGGTCTGVYNLPPEDAEFQSGGYCTSKVNNCQSGNIPTYTPTPKCVCSCAPPPPMPPDSPDAGDSE
jgi:hypothetical protein